MKKRRGSDSGRWSGSGNVKERENGRGNETERGSVGGKATLLCTRMRFTQTLTVFYL